MYRKYFKDGAKKIIHIIEKSIHSYFALSLKIDKIDKMYFNLTKSILG